MGFFPINLNPTVVLELISRPLKRGCSQRGQKELIVDISACVKLQFCFLSHFLSSKPRKGSCFCKVLMRGVRESENWGLLGF